MSEESAELFDREPGVSNDGKHRKGVNRIVSWNRNGSAAIGHDDMTALPNHFEASSLKSLYRLKMVNAW
jgi:hypothetical protein